MSKRRQQRYHQTQNFYKSLQLLQAGKLLREGGLGEGGVAEDGTPFEDYSIFLYRQQAPVFNDRVKDLERKLLFPVSDGRTLSSPAPARGPPVIFVVVLVLVLPKDTVKGS